MKFSYIAVDNTGVKKKGVIESNNQQEVVEYLHTNKMLPLKISQVKGSFPTSLPFFKPISNQDIVLFTRQLSSMITTGMTLIEALNILKQQNPKPQMENMIGDLVSNISEGGSFSQALSNHPELFSTVYIALIKAAESGGLLDKVMERLADNLEKSDNLKKQIRGALFYPMIIVVGVIGVIIIMNIFVMPQLGTLYQSLNVPLPLSTQIILTSSHYSLELLPILIVGIIILFVLFQRFKKTERGAEMIDKLKLKIPVFGEIERLSILDEVARTLSLIISSGTSIIEGLNITSNVAGNILFKKALDESADLVEKGIPLSQALDNQGIFPPTLVQMVKVGEASGKIDDGLLRVSQYYERDVNLRIKTLTTSIEPFLIITLGIAVAFLIFSVITPIYSIISKIQ
jgi:type II secretory pathway component PulF